MPKEAAVDRNWNELLQTLRVTQTGLQTLTGFLVSIRTNNGVEGNPFLVRCGLSVNMHR
jgi:hypothetical protein